MRVMKRDDVEPSLPETVGLLCVTSGLFVLVVTLPFVPFAGAILVVSVLFGLFSTVATQMAGLVLVECATALWIAILGNWLGPDTGDEESESVDDVHREYVTGEIVDRELEERLDEVVSLGDDLPRRECPRGSTFRVGVRQVVMPPLRRWTWWSRPRACVGGHSVPVATYSVEQRAPH